MDSTSFNIIVIGAARSGKSALIESHRSETFTTRYTPGSLTDVASLEFHTTYGPITLNICEIRPNQECHGADGAIIMAGSSGVMVIQQTLELMDRYRAIPAVLCAGYCDLLGATSCAMELFRHIPPTIPMCCISAKTKYNCEEPFLHLMRYLVAEDIEIMCDEDDDSSDEDYSPDNDKDAESSTSLSYDEGSSAESAPSKTARRLDFDEKTIQEHVVDADGDCAMEEIA